MRVYRIQDAYGTGPYRRKIGQDTQMQIRMENAHCNQFTHPTEMVDFARMHIEGERFGFDSMQALMAWFGPYLKHLIADGYKVQIYEVPRHGVRWGRSRKQVMFQSKISKPVAPKGKKVS
jgi:hypothetical protein